MARSAGRVGVLRETPLHPPGSHLCFRAMLADPSPKGEGRSHTGFRVAKLCYEG
jgi:hypothetical protein